MRFKEPEVQNRDGFDWTDSESLEVLSDHTIEDGNNMAGNYKPFPPRHLKKLEERSQHYAQLSNGEQFFFGRWGASSPVKRDMCGEKIKYGY